ncbi:hypothetical protein [Caballeronia udeis]|nr:hypothetical protein [Caballeronia udeis]
MIKLLLLAYFGIPIVGGIPTAAVADDVVTVRRQMLVSTDGNTCPITFEDPYGGRATNSRYVTDNLHKPGNHRGELYLQFKCISSGDTDQIKHTLSAGYDERQQKWTRDVDGLLPVEKLTTRNFPVRAVNSDGFAVTYDAINGDPKTRSRAFAFCLRRPPVMLCGSTPDIARPYYRQSDLLPFALKLVRSIEFGDSPSVRSGKSDDPAGNPPISP